MHRSCMRGDGTTNRPKEILCPTGLQLWRRWRPRLRIRLGLSRRHHRMVGRGIRHLVGCASSLYGSKEKGAEIGPKAIARKKPRENPAERKKLTRREGVLANSLKKIQIK